MKDRYIKDLNMECNILLVCVLTLTFIFIIWLCVAIREKTELKKENVQLQQQVIDYKWQLEQIEYVINCQKGE